MWQLLNNSQKGNATAGGAGSGAVQNGSATGSGTGVANVGFGMIWFGLHTRVNNSINHFYVCHNNQVDLALVWESEVQFRPRSEIWPLDKAAELQLEDKAQYCPGGFSLKNMLTCWHTYRLTNNCVYIRVYKQKVRLWLWLSYCWSCGRPRLIIPCPWSV